jgi:glycosyltransferase involved in cell wall biosynthesis
MLSLAMIIWNEENTLEDTINSVSDYVDEIVIGIDSASNDGSREIAERLADKVITTDLSKELDNEGPLDGSDSDWGFSAARNLVLDQCDPENWRLILDGHEIFMRPEKLKEEIERISSIGGDGIEIPVFFERDKDGIFNQRFSQARLLGPDVRYNNPNHNVPVIKNLFTSGAMAIEHCKQKQALESRVARDKQRSSSNIGGLKERVEKNPKDSRAWFYLAQTYQENGMWSEAAEAFEKYLEISTWKEERWHARNRLGACYGKLYRINDAREQHSLSLEEFPAMAEGYYCLGYMAYNEQKFQEAKVWLEKCVQLEMPVCKLFLRPRIYLFDRWHQLSMVYHHTKEYDKAIEVAKKALEVSDNAQVKKNIAYWEKFIKRIK